MSLFLTVEEEKEFSFVQKGQFSVSSVKEAEQRAQREWLCRTFNHQLLLIVDLQVFKCVVFIIKKGEVVLNMRTGKLE